MLLKAIIDELLERSYVDWTDNKNSENLFSLFKVILLVLNSFSKEPYHITKSMIKNSIVNIKHI